MCAEKLGGKVICSHGDVLENRTKADWGGGGPCWGDVPHKCTEEQINGRSRA